MARPGKKNQVGNIRSSTEKKTIEWFLPPTAVDINARGMAERFNRHFEVFYVRSNRHPRLHIYEMHYVIAVNNLKLINECFENYCPFKIIKYYLLFPYFLDVIEID